jgi:hypothetical protein
MSQKLFISPLWYSRVMVNRKEKDNMLLNYILLDCLRQTEKNFILSKWDSETFPEMQALHKLARRTSSRRGNWRVAFQTSP